LLADLKKTEDVETFLKDFLTPAELIVLSKRLAILWSLHQGKSYEEIKKEFNVSSATIATLAENRHRLGITKALSTLKLDDWADKVAQKIMKLPKWGQ
jgi:Trp operon repressor